MMRIPWGAKSPKKTEDRSESDSETKAAIRALAGDPRACVRAGAPRAAFERLQAERGILLPQDQVRILRGSNGIEVFDGYFRLFGLYEGGGIDAVLWNSPEHWKFAWDGRGDQYWCFAETALGDQYAYRLNEHGAIVGEDVFQLSGFNLEANHLFTSFAAFFNTELIGWSKKAFDPMIRAAHQKFGPLAIDRHLVFNPPIFIAPEDINHVQLMPARAAMVTNGDIVIQIDARSDRTSRLGGMEPYVDDLGRTRLKLNWV